MPNEPRPDDYESWLQCSTCFWLCPIHAAEKEATVKNAIETTESPYENKTYVLGTAKRAKKYKTGKKVTRHMNKKIGEETDPEIAREIRQHGSDNVKILKYQ
jgi:hypothetical protein